MAGFGESLRLFADKVDGRLQQVFVGSVNHVYRSIVDGSPTTGAPGQPVDTGNLKASWTEAFPEELVGTVSTNVVYAEPIEEGIGPYGPMTLRSQVGGFHSLKLTRASWDRIVQEEVTLARGF